MSECPFNPGSGARMSFKNDMAYGDYLQLDKLLNAQNPLSDAHDEMLFIVQHQTSELWMRLVITELEVARAALQTRNLQVAFKTLTRVARIFEQLNSAWDVLRTMTPSEYTRFRKQLGASSGFQSHQYRKIEYMLGNRNVELMQLHAHRPEDHRNLSDELKKNSLYNEAIILLHYELDKPVPEQIDLTKPHQSDPGIQKLWKEIYENSKRYWSMYELAEKLVDLEDYFRRWRFNHVTTVERIIGFKRGTGGTSGVDYLKSMLSVELFPELWRVRGDL